MENKTIMLNENYSTTRLLTKEQPKTINNPDDKFGTVFFLPEGEEQKGEGGLRPKGYFKQSYPDKPLISIITVVFNGEKYLEETIQSVINQTYDNVEYIIIDGQSTDGTLDIIRKYEHVIDYWISEKDNGIYDAWNKGIRASSGEWIGFLGADDIYLPDAIEKYISLINITKSVKYISAQNVLCSDDLKPLRTIGSKWNNETFSRFMNVAHVGSLHHRDLFDQYGLYDTTFKICGDYELLLRVAPTLKAEYLDHITCYMRDGGISNNNLYTFIETYRAKIMHGKNPFVAKIEMYLALLKWYIRQKVWH
jgi:glycosyltransferase involved in cell wall biosynthesis